MLLRDDALPATATLPSFVWQMDGAPLPPRHYGRTNGRDATHQVRTPL